MSLAPRLALAKKATDEMNKESRFIGFSFWKSADVKYLVFSIIQGNGSMGDGFRFRWRFPQLLAIILIP
jgi:hypothetical protein